MSENGEIYTAGTDGMDKFHLCGRSAPSVLKSIKYAGPNNRVNHQLHHTCRWNHNAKHFLRTTQQDS